MAKLPGKARRTDMNLARALGASASTSVQVLSLYLPSRDHSGAIVPRGRKWVMRAATILARIGGGVTIMPAVEGGWVDRMGRIIWEKTIIVYTYVRPEAFLRELPALRTFLHRFGRETNQGEVVVEFDGSFYRIEQFDGP